jgi:hypothetical protein
MGIPSKKRIERVQAFVYFAGVVRKTLHTCSCIVFFLRRSGLRSRIYWVSIKFGNVNS